MVSDGIGWSWMVTDGLGWSLMVADGVSWSVVVDFDYHRMVQNSQTFKWLGWLDISGWSEVKEHLWLLVMTN